MVPDWTNPRRVARALALETGANIKTVDAWLAGCNVTELVDWALRAAAEKLGCATEAKILRDGARGEGTAA
jgi:hypothetical protein